MFLSMASMSVTYQLHKRKYGIWRDNRKMGPIWSFVTAGDPTLFYITYIQYSVSWVTYQLHKRKHVIWRDNRKMGPIWSFVTAEVTPRFHMTYIQCSVSWVTYQLHKRKHVIWRDNRKLGPIWSFVTAGVSPRFHMTYIQLCCKTASIGYIKKHPDIQTSLEYKYNNAEIYVEKLKVFDNLYHRHGVRMSKCEWVRETS